MGASALFNRSLERSEDRRFTAPNREGGRAPERIERLERYCGEWATWSRVVVHAMIDIEDAGHGIDDLFLRWRLRDLLRRGIITSNQALPLWDEHSNTMITLAS